jgi:hypothetical protein
MHFLVSGDFEFKAGQACVLWSAEAGVKSADYSRCTVDGTHLYPLLKTHYRGRDIVLTWVKISPDRHDDIWMVRGAKGTLCLSRS